MSLQVGHRVSVDLDLFGGTGPLDSDVLTAIVNQLGAVETLTASQNILIFKVNGVKVDFVNYRYPLLRPIVETEGIRMASLADIAAMKLAAIAGRGRKRDFTDLFFLMQHFSLSEMLDFYQKKYHDGNLFLVMKSLTYFDDADSDLDLQLLKSATWEQVKSTIEKAARTVQ